MRIAAAHPEVKRILIVEDADFRAFRRRGTLFGIPLQEVPRDGCICPHGLIKGPVDPGLLPCGKPDGANLGGGIRMV